MSLDEIRAKIDALDEQILKLLNERAQCAVEIGAIKRSTTPRSTCPSARRWCSSGCASATRVRCRSRPMRAIYREVISSIRALEKQISVAFLGPRDTFSHMAAMRIFGVTADYHPLPRCPNLYRGRAEADRLRDRAGGKLDGRRRSRHAGPVRELPT